MPQEKSLCTESLIYYGLNDSMVEPGVGLTTSEYSFTVARNKWTRGSSKIKRRLLSTTWISATMNSVDRYNEPSADETGNERGQAGINRPMHLADDSIQSRGSLVTNIDMHAML